MSNLSVDNGTGVNGYVDTLAQSFFIDAQVMVTRIDLFFSNADLDRPVELNLRKVNDNEPSDNVIAGSSVVVPAAQINTSSNGYANTSFTFNAPIYLDVGQYAFCLSSDSGLNKVHTGDLGVADNITGEVINKKERAGTLFKSTNGLVWDQDITKDIKFNLFRANVTNTTGTVDFVINRSLPYPVTNKKLSFDPFKTYEGSAVVKVNHPRHGFRATDSVKFTQFPGKMYYTSNANLDVKFNGIPYPSIANTFFTVSNVTNDSYTIILGTNTDTTANITGGTFGGNTITATTFVPYNAIYPSIGTVIPPGTGINHKVKTTDTDLTVGSFENVDPDNIVFNDTKLLVDAKNRTDSMSNAEPLVYRMEISADGNFLSPQIRLPYSSLQLFTNDINNPSTSDGLDLDVETIASSNVQVSFDDAGTVTIGGLAEQANVKTMIPGGFVIISNTTEANNSGTFRLVSVDPAGTSFNIPISNTEAAGNAITITYDPEFISDLAATGTSSRAKYITREIDLETPATGVLIRFTVSKPSGVSVEAYLRTSTDGETEPLATKEFAEISLPTIPDTLPDEFVEVEALTDSLESFDSFAVKLVMKSDTYGGTPKIKDLRVIALA